MTMRTQWEKMGFSRCTLFTIRCATKTEVLADIIKTATLRESTLTQENTMCDFPRLPMGILANV